MFLVWLLRVKIYMTATAPGGTTKRSDSTALQAEAAEILLLRQMPHGKEFEPHAAVQRQQIAAHGVEVHP